MIKQFKRILIIRSGAIGDVIMTTPLIREIKQKHKECELHYLTGNWSVGAIKNNPFIDKIITFEDNIIHKKKLLPVLNLIKQLRKNKYDLVIILDKSYMWNLLAKFVSKFRVGFDRDGEGFANNLNVKYDGSKYEVEYYKMIGELLGITPDYNLEVYPQEMQNIVLDTKPTIGIAPLGGNNPGQCMSQKIWPLENYISLINSLPNDIQIILFGGPTDSNISEQLKNKNNIINMIGKLSIPQTVEMMSYCDVILTQDSGTLHMAVASNKPIIALFGPTSPISFAPKHNCKIIKVDKECSPCYTIYGKHGNCEHCMDNIKVETVYKELSKYMR